MRKICIISDLHLCNNPRVWKEANSLAKAGYDVTVLTIFTSLEKKNADLEFVKEKNFRYEAAINLIPGECNHGFRLLQRLRGKFAKWKKKFSGLDSVRLIGYAPELMTRKAVSENADLYIAHVEYGLVVGCELMNLGKKVAFDLEDWYSRDYINLYRPVKLFEALEAQALNFGTYCTCPSGSMAYALEQKYKAKKKVEVIFNGFSVIESLEVEEAVKKVPNSLVWFSQTIGPGRGIETAIKCLEFVNKPVSLHLLGELVNGYREKLVSIFPFSLGHELIFHPVVSHQELVPFISKFSIGLSIENHFPESRDKTITNKILQYLQANLKILATDTSGQIEVSNYFKGIIEVVEVDEPRKWAKSLEILLETGGVNRSHVMEKFAEIFSWEAQEKKLLKLIGNANEN